MFYFQVNSSCMYLTHWCRVTHICVGKLIIIGSDNGLSPDRRQAIIWTNAELLSIGHLQTYFSENLIKMQQFSLKKMHVKMSSAKWRLSCLGLNVLIAPCPGTHPTNTISVTFEIKLLKKSIYSFSHIIGITAKVCSCHHSCAVALCAKFVNKFIQYNKSHPAFVKR